MLRGGALRDALAVKVEEREPVEGGERLGDLLGRFLAQNDDNEVQLRDEEMKRESKTCGCEPDDMGQESREGVRVRWTCMEEAGRV